ncbi:MAG TPA: beta-L-arabinofuranosidase domain-containing protein [Blastocatellia bacterium]|nr:beta-L-arabinofuranosidase domain-containing protein [Blastocatellia bacterium]
MHHADGLVTPSSVSIETAQWLLKQARARCEGRRLDEAAAPTAVTAARPTTLLVTTFRRGQAARPLAGNGASLLAALKAALGSISTTSPDRIQIDLLEGEMLPLDAPSASEPDASLSAAQLIQPGVEGLAIQARGQTFYLPPAHLILARIFADAADAQPAEDLLDRAARYFGVGDWRGTAVSLRRFRTVAFVEDPSQRTALELTAVGLRQEVNRARLDQAARAGGDYLIRVMKADGSFHYFYDPLSDRAGEGDYNIVRHAGATIALLQLYEATREPRYLEAARRAVGFLQHRFRWAREADAVYVLDDDGQAKLGANGLALVALCLQMRLDSRSASRANARRLANLILRMQRGDGSFASYYDLKDGPHERASLYYPGEALLGLIELYKQTGERRLIEAARRGADYLITSQRGLTRLPLDAWLMQALEALYSITHEARLAAHAINLGAAMIDEQYTESNQPFYAGGYGPGVPRATPAASRAEGLLAALRLARSTKDGRAERFAEALKLGARFQLSQQFNEENSYYLAHPERAAGGFRESLTSARIRIDYVQHNISSLLGIAQIVAP